MNKLFRQKLKRKTVFVSTTLKIKYKGLGLLQKIYSRIKRQTQTDKTEHSLVKNNVK